MGGGADDTRRTTLVSSSTPATCRPTDSAPAQPSRRLLHPHAVGRIVAVVGGRGVGLRLPATMTCPRETIAQSGAFGNRETGDPLGICSACYGCVLCTEMMRKIATRCVLGGFVLGLALQAHATEFGPQSVMRRFCQIDGVGQRVRVAGWADVAPLVTWPLEPAWDHIVLIGGYQVGSPTGYEDGAVDVQVSYAVIGQLSAMGLDTAVQTETVEFRFQASPQGWRIVGPPQPPHIFASRVDIDALRQSLQAGGVNLMPNSLFLWQMFQSAGWNVPFVSTLDILNGTAYRTVEQPRPGDVAVYLREGTPYHLGILQEADQIVSSTLNGGIVRTATDAFPGEVRYLRLVQPEPAPEDAAVATDGPVGADSPSVSVTPSAVQSSRSARSAKHAVQKRGKSRVRRAQHPRSKRVRKRGSAKVHAPTAVKKTIARP